jgi:C-terminal processing protease CtpA/Prc
LIEATLEVREGVQVAARLVVDLGSSALALRLGASFVEKHSDAFAGVRGDDRYDASGLTLDGAEDRVGVDFVARDSPAADAGLRPGDAMLRLDGQEVRARDLDRVRRALREAGATRILHVERLGSVPLPLRSLV